MDFLFDTMKDRRPNGTEKRGWDRSGGNAQVCDLRSR